MSTLEQIHRGILRGPMATEKTATNSGAAWAGRASVASGDGTALITTTAVNADSIVLTGFQSYVGSNVSQVVKVASINPGVNMTLEITPAPVGPEFDIMFSIMI